MDDVLRRKLRVEHRVAPGGAERERGERGGREQEHRPPRPADERREGRCYRERTEGATRDGAGRGHYLAGDERRGHHRQTTPSLHGRLLGAGRTRTATL